MGDSQWQQSFDQAATQQDWENALALQKYKDALEQQEYENQFNQQQYQDAKTQQEWENAYKELTGGVSVELPDESLSVLSASPGYSSVLSGATNLYRNGYSGEAIANYLQTRVDSGIITPQEAETIAAQIVGG